MGRILIFSIGPDIHEVGTSSGNSQRTGRITPPETWTSAALPRIAEEKPAAVYYCDLPGARQCAEQIGRHLGLPAQPVPGLEDQLDHGWKGMSGQDYLMIEGGDSAKDIASDDLRLPFTDNAGNLRAALASSLDGLARQHKRESIIIVSHRMLTVLMALHLLHMSNRHYLQISQEFGALNLFEVRAGMPSALYLNDTCHLYGLL